MNKKKDSKVVPNVRFKGFTDDWEQRKLTEIVNRVNKSSNSDVLPKVEFEDIVSGEGRLNKDISSKFDSRKGTLFEPENILYGKLRPYLKNWLFSDFEGVALGDFWVFEATDVSVPSFDYYLIQSDDYQKVANDTSGTKMPRSDWKNVSSTDFAIPSKDEQKQIGAFFKQLDDTITLHQQKITRLIKLKKAMLEKMFPKKGTVIPEIRFNGFANAWEQRKLGDIADVTKLAGFEFTEHVVYSDEGNIIALRGLNIKNGQLILDDVKYIDGSNFSKLSRSKLFINDIMFTYVGTVGEVAIIKENDRFYLAPNVSRIRVKSDDSPKFISHYMRTDNFKNKVIFPLIATSSQPALSMENIRKFTINIPINREEQDCLAKYFDSLDHLITLHQRKIDKIKNMKKAMLDQMFI